MNISNIKALANQLQLIGFEDVSCEILKRISFKPNSFYITREIERANDRISFQIFCECKKGEAMYEWKFYDAILQEVSSLAGVNINGVDVYSLEMKMGLVNWKRAFDFDELKSWNEQDRSTWENEQKVETIVSDLQKLEANDEGRIVGESLKSKFWSGNLYTRYAEKINYAKSKQEISQRFYFLDGQQGITVDEAYRFLQNRKLEKQLQLKRKANETPELVEEDEGSSSASGNGLLKKKRSGSNKRIRGMKSHI